LLADKTVQGKRVLSASLFKKHLEHICFHPLKKLAIELLLKTYNGTRSAVGTVQATLPSTTLSAFAPVSRSLNEHLISLTVFPEVLV